jgi:hypothetical protein
VAPKLTARAPTARGGHGEPDRWNRGRRGGLTRPGADETKQLWFELTVMANEAWRRETRGGIGCGGGRGVLMVPFIGWGGKPRERGRVKRWPSMADGFKALRGREGVMGSAHSRGSEGHMATSRIPPPWRVGRAMGGAARNRWRTVSSFRLKEGERGRVRVGRLGPKGRAERAGSKEQEYGPQSGCEPKCKRAAETVFDFGTRFLDSTLKGSNTFELNLN